MKKRMILGSILLAMSMTSPVLAETRPTAKQFPNRTIIIGEYAIVIDALTNELYALADQSAQTSGQDKIYFKSDINAGTWYDISNSTSITEISTTKDNIVTNTVIDNTPLRYYTKITGVTVDFQTGSEVPVYSLSDKTDPANMEEMAELVQELEIQKAMKKNSAGGSAVGAKIESIQRVMAKIMAGNEKKYNDTQKEIQAIDRQLAALEKTINRMAESGVSAKTIAAANSRKLELEKKKDAICYDVVYSRLEQESKKLDYEDSLDVIEKYATVMSNIREAQLELGVDSGGENNHSGTKSGSEMLEEKLSETLAEALEEAMDGGNLTAVEAALADLATLESVNKNDTNLTGAELEKQMAMLEEMKTACEDAVNAAISAANGSEEYKQALRDGSSAATIDMLQEKMAAEVAAAITELMENDDKLNSRITGEGKEAKQAENLQKTAAVIAMAEHSAPAAIQTKIAAALQSVKEENANKLNEVKLAAVPAYAALTESIEAVQNAIDVQYEAYMGAVENKNVGELEAVQKQLDVLSEQKNAAQRTAAAIREQVQKGVMDVNPATGTVSGANAEALLKEAAAIANTNESAVKTAESLVNAALGGTGSADDATDAGGTDGTGSAGGAAGTGGTGNAGGADGTGSAGGTGGANGTGSAGGATGANQQALAVQEAANTADGRYSQAEAESIAQSVLSLGGNYEMPWKIRFTDYNVKLTSPIYVNGKEVYVPVNELSAQLGIRVIYSDTKNAIVLRKGGGIIEFIPNDTVVYINDKKQQVKPAPSALYRGKMYLPLSCFERAFGFTETTYDKVLIVSKK